ncbi:archaea-specific SMC-related protein [Natrialbaceae archaeon A-chndr2]
MSTSETTTRPTVTVKNIGGIDSSTVELTDGVNVLTGKNATNRTSFLRSIMAALGSDKASLKGDADEGYVRLTIQGETYERRFERRNGTVVTSGSPYLEDPTLANLFAFLLESNAARQAVTQQRNLRDVIMRPIDVDEIEAQIQTTTAEKRKLDQELERLEETKSTLPSLESRKRSLEDEIEATEDELETARSELEKARTEREPDDEAVDEKLDELQRARNELEETRFQQETERQSIETLEDELEELREDLEELPSSLETDPDALETELEELRERRSSIDAETSKLQSIIQFNEEMLEGTNQEITAALSEEEAASVTDQLVEPDDEVVCWTCGSSVERAQIEATIDRLRSLREEKVHERNQLRQQIDDRKSTIENARSITDRRQRLTKRVDQTETEIDTRTERLETLESQEETLEERVETLEETVSELETESEDETLDQQKTVTELEFRLERKRDELADVEADIEAAEDAADRIEAVRDERDAVAERLTELRTRIDRIEEEAVEAFNEHMASVLEVLEYENIERIWIEQTEQNVKQGRRRVEQTVFELHIVRQTEDGQTYEDTIEHLSESEREVTGLVFALAGYLVHDVYETVPFMLLDSLEAIDSNRIARLIDYFSDYADTLVTALLPEDAAALNDEYRRVTSI